MEEVKQAKITTLSDLYQQTADFLRAIRSISPEYYTKWLRTANPELLSNNISKSASFAT
ncbi:hypothetical protein CKAH01_12461 [Colletotrichum kahawae]|uniref:Uncharacterized protein n=1 Tax=Colletotrichum kahawae TaxID=34407 RepID=A0AAE0DB52_COLKA|nr:hypothetical protein CKAH01_12461 [Colletotrichum kahawae]